MRTAIALASLAAGHTAVLAQDFSNNGGTAKRNGLVSARGPLSPILAWSDNASSIISWQPVIDQGRVFVVKQSGFPTNGGSAGDRVAAYSQATGSQLWSVTIPFTGQTTTGWTAWIAGARDGRVYTSRAGNGASVSQNIIALDGASGATLWTSAATVNAGPYDGVVFAPDGDLIVADFTHVTRIDGATGATVWRVTRNCSVSSSCGCAATDSAAYIVVVAAGGQAVRKLDLNTGATLYTGPVMPGFLAQNTPFLSPDGSTVYFNRTQNNPATDFFYAWRDTGSGFSLAWSLASLHTVFSESGVGPDGSVYAFLPSLQLARLDAGDGSILGTTAPLPTLGVSPLTARMAVDSSGVVYVSNGWASTPATQGRTWAFSPDLATTFFTLTTDRPNIGGPALAADGTLIVGDRNGLRAYRAPRCLADINVDGTVDLVDFFAFLAAYDTANILADLDGNPGVDLGDFFTFFAAYDAQC